MKEFRGTRPLLGLLALACCLAYLPVSTVHAQAPGKVQKVATIEGITEYRLDNGLRVLLFPDPSTNNVTVNLTMLVGSRHEGYGETGMAHLLEHMVFKGTPMHKNVPQALKEHGARFNGSTWTDRTNYYETMTGNDKNLEFAIRLEADRMINSFVRREDLVKEMTVVRNEFEAGENSPTNILSQRMMAVAYEWHNYGKSTIGNRSDIERVPIDNLKEFYKRFYQPDNAVLIVAGKFEEMKALGYVLKYFGVIPKPKRRLNTTYTEEPAQDGERNVVLRRVGKVGVVGAIYHVPATAHEDFAAVEILNSILVSEPSGRLYKALVPTKKANSVSGAAYGWHDPGVLEFQVQVDAEKPLKEVRDTMIDLLEKLATAKFTKEEVERAKTRFKSRREQLMRNSNRLGTHMSEWVAKGDWRLFFLHRDRVAKVTPEDVSRVARKYLRASNRTVGLFIPAKESQQSPIPETPVVADLVKDYKSTQTVSVGEAFDPTPQNIEKRVQRMKSGGVQVALLPKKTRGEAIVLQLTLRFGNEKSLAGKNSACNLLATMMRRGTKKYTRQQLQDELAKLGSQLSVGSGLGYLTVNVQTKKENLPKVVELLKEVLRAPTFPKEEFDILKRENIDPLRKAQAQPTSLAARMLSRQLNPYDKDDIRYLPTIEESIARLEAVTLDQVKELYAKQVGAGNATLAVVGDFDPNLDAKGNPIGVLLKEGLGNWKASVAYERIASPSKMNVSGRKNVILTPDKKNAFYIAGHNLSLTDADPEYAALVIANYIYGGSTLSSRIGDRVRQKDGLSYGARSILSSDSKDKAGRFFMYAICNPINIKKVDQAVAEEIQRFIKDGVESAELTAAVKAYLQARQVARSSDSRLASQLDQALQDERTFVYHAELEKKIAALTTKEVNSAIQKHLNHKKLIIVSAGDFKEK